MSSDKNASEDDKPSADNDLLARPRQRPFDKRQRELRIAPERARRQWLIVNLAYALLGDRDDTMDFLNTHNGSLGERPLDLAMKNAAGFAAVESAIRLLAMPPLGGRQ